MEAAAQAMIRLKQASLPVYCVDGNHDERGKPGQDCLGLLHGQSLIHLLYPIRDAAGEPHITPYNGDTGCIAYAGGVRIIGFGFLGDATMEKALLASRELEPFDGVTIALLPPGYTTARCPSAASFRRSQNI